MYQAVDVHKVLYNGVPDINFFYVFTFFLLFCGLLLLLVVTGPTGGVAGGWLTCMTGGSKQTVHPKTTFDARYAYQ